MFVTLEDGFLVIRVPIKTEIIPALEMHPEVVEATMNANMFTSREWEVIKLLIEGDRKTSKDIANALNISVRTAKFHLASLFEKTGLNHAAHGTRRELLVDLMRRKFGQPKGKVEYEILPENSNAESNDFVSAAECGPRLRGVRPGVPTDTGT